MPISRISELIESPPCAYLTVYCESNIKLGPNYFRRDIIGDTHTLLWFGYNDNGGNEVSEFNFVCTSRFTDSLFDSGIRDSSGPRKLASFK